MKKKKKTSNSKSSSKAKTKTGPVSQNELGSVTKIKYEDWKVKWLTGIQVNGNPNVGGSEYNQDILLT